MTERQLIGYTEREEGFYELYAPPEGSIVTHAFILCRYCHGAIYHCMGPRYDSVCITCYEKDPALRERLSERPSMKRDYDTQEQCDEFEIYLKEYPHGRVQHPANGAYGYKEEEWEAFQSGWNAAKKHFGVTE